MTDDLLSECSAVIKCLCMGEQRRALLTEEQLALIDATLGKIEDARKQRPWLAPKRMFRWFGRRDGVRWAVTWLANRAKEMNDDHAKIVLNSAATNLGWAGARLHKLNQYHDLGVMVSEDMAKAAYEKRREENLRWAAWESITPESKEREIRVLRAAIEAGI